MRTLIKCQLLLSPLTSECLRFKQRALKNTKYNALFGNRLEEETDATEFKEEKIIPIEWRTPMRCTARSYTSRFRWT